MLAFGFNFLLYNYIIKTLAFGLNFYRKRWPLGSQITQCSKYIVKNSNLCPKYIYIK